MEPVRDQGENGNTLTVERQRDRDGLAAKIQALAEADTRVGFPATCPNVYFNFFGWFWQPHQVVMHKLIDSSTTCILELGSFLGKSTNFLAQQAPHATVIAVDLWDNDFLIGDSTYNQSEENLGVLRSVALYETFLVNLWPQRCDHEGSYARGVLPMRMKTVEAIEMLHKASIRPDLIYIDAGHHYDDVLADIELCLRYFPSAAIMGDDWDWPEVRRAVEENARKYGKEIYVEADKCWTYVHMTREELQPIRQLYVTFGPARRETVLSSRVDNASSG